MANFFSKSFGDFSAVKVISEHDDKIEWKFLVRFGHGPRDVVLRLLSRSHVSDHGKSHRPGL